MATYEDETLVAFGPDENAQDEPMSGLVGSVDIESID